MIRKLLLLGLSLSVCVFPVRGAVHVWTGASSASFSDPANWIGGSPDGDGDAELSFPASAARLDATNDLPSLMVRTITFSGSGYTVGGNAIALAGGAEILEAMPGPNELACDLVLANGATLFADAAAQFRIDEGALTVSGTISGNGPLVKLGDGKVRLSGSAPNAYSGATRVLNGVLQLDKSNAVAAVPGDLEIGGSVVTTADEQIPDNATIRISGALNVMSRETVGPLVVAGGATLSTRLAGASIGTIILGGDITVKEGASSNDARFDGDIRLSGIRTITTCPSCSTLNLDRVAGETPDTGLTIRGAAKRQSVVIRGTYTGPTIVEDADVSVNNPSTTVRLRGGTIRGRCRSLVSEWGTVDLGTYGSLVTTGDIRLSPATIVSVRLSEPRMNAGGVLDLASATLLMDDDSRTVGAEQVIIANSSGRAVLGTFRGIREGDVYEGRLRVSYRGGDGNDISVTRTGRFPTEVKSSNPAPVTVGEPAIIEATVTVYSWSPVTTGRVILREGDTVLATATPDETGHVTFTAHPTYPGTRYTLAYVSDSELLGSTAVIFAPVRAPQPSITSFEPASAIGGTVVTGVLHGTNFYEGGYVSATYPFTWHTTFVSASEVRFTLDAPRYDHDLTIGLTYVQPDGARSNEVLLTLEAKPLPPGNISAEERALTARVVPGGGAAWLGMFPANGHWYYLAAVTPDSDHDGIARWELNGTVPSQAFWIATDMMDGTVSATRVERSAPPVTPLPHAMFLRDSAGRYSHISMNAVAGSWRMMWVHRGVGAWLIEVSDGGTADLDHTANGRILFDVSQMRGADDHVTLPPPAGVEPGDAFTAMELYSVQWMGERVDEHLQEADGPGVVAFVRRTGSSWLDVAEDAGVARVMVMRVDGTDGTVSVNYATADGTARAGLQYAPVAGTLTFGPGEMLKTIEIPIVDDDRYYGRTTLNLVLSNPAGTTIAGETKLPIRILENDAAPALRVQDVRVAEGDEVHGEATVTVGIASPTSIPIVASWLYEEDPPYGPSVLGGKVTFTPGGAMTQTVIVPYRGNGIADGDRRINVGLVVEEDGQETRSGYGVITIVDDDVPEVTILDASADESQDAATVLISITPSSDKDLFLTYATASGTALAGSDFSATGGTINVERTREQLVTIPLIHDANAEGPETFTVTLSDVKNARVVRGTATVVINDHTPSELPELSMTVSPGVEAVRAPVMVRFNLSRPATQTVEFWISTQSGTAIADRDFGRIDQLYAIPAGLTELTLGIDTLYDEDDREGNETFTIALSQPSGVVIATPFATATIVDRFVTPSAAVVGTNVTLTEGDAGTKIARFVIQRTDDGTSTITIPYATVDASAVASSDYIAASGTLTLMAGENEKTIDVAIIGDRIYEHDEEFVLTVGATPIICRIVNDDARQSRRRAAH